MNCDSCKAAAPQPQKRQLLMSRLEPQMHKRFSKIIIKEDIKYHFMTPDGGGAAGLRRPPSKT